MKLSSPSECLYQCTLHCGASTNGYPQDNRIILKQFIHDPR